ncbi:MAG: protein kinase, partial [Chloroflexales bacterium]|nr:protein kinase [Chloroflexales bacterium]
MSTPRAPARIDKRAAEPTAELRNYKLHERLSQEELATVYRASHLTLDRPVQVHLLRRHDWISASRFQLAARLAARLSHPNLVPVIDAGHDDKYGDYLVTPQLDTRPLSAILAEGPLPALQAVRVASQVAASLDYLHSEQVFHRDVQPANILVAA